MLEFLIEQNSSETPGFLSVLLAVLSALFLAALIVITYEFTTRENDRSIDFLQSLALISIVAAMVMQAIGDSLARGLGMLGALAIIRFRTRLDNPRNMTFMFASLAAGISCGVFGFTIAFVGTVVFCLLAVVLKFTHFRRSSDLYAELRISIPTAHWNDHHLEDLLAKHSRKWTVKQYRIKSTSSATTEGEGEIQVKEITYELVFESPAEAHALLRQLNDLRNVEDIRMQFDSNTIEI